MPYRRRAVLASAGTAIGSSIAGCASSSKDNNNNSAGTTQPTDEEQVDDVEQDNFEKIEFQAISFPRSTFPLRLEYANQIVTRWQEDLGLNISLQPKEASAAFNALVERDYNMHMTAGWGGRPERIDPDTFLSAFQTSEPGGLNWAAYSNKEYDSVVEKSKSATDRKKRQEHAYKAQEILAEDQPVIFMFARNGLSATNTQNWSNYTQQIGGRPFTHVYNLMSMEPKTDAASTAVLAATRDPQTYNPMGLEQTQDIHGNKLVYDRLVRLGPDGEVKPWAATEWNIPDPSTVEVTLRDGMTFHDGESVTPEDVKFTIEYLKKWKVPYLASFYDVIESVDVTGNNGVTFNLTKPYVPFVGVSLPQIGILPQHIWGGVAEENNLEHPRQWSDFKPIGSGPFKLNFYEADNRSVLQVYDDHFADFNISEFIWRMYGGNSAAMGSVERGKSSYMEFIQPTQYQRATNTSGVKAQKSKYHGWGGIYMNHNRRPFGDRAFRVALSHVVNKQRLRELVFNGLADILHGPIAPAAKFWHNPDLKSYTGGRSKARQILKDAGYKWDQNGNLLMPKQ
jgi:peptide/nickel transport system substrate-binding protein